MPKTPRLECLGGTLTAMSADIRDWWPRLTDQTREWLVQHTGEPMPADVVEQVVAAGGPASSDAWWGSGADPETGVYLSAEAQRAIEQLSKGK